MEIMFNPLNHPCEIVASSLVIGVGAFMCFGLGVEPTSPTFIVGAAVGSVGFLALISNLFDRVHGRAERRAAYAEQHSIALSFQERQAQALLDVGNNEKDVRDLFREDSTGCWDFQLEGQKFRSGSSYYWVTHVQHFINEGKFEKAQEYAEALAVDVATHKEIYDQAAKSGRKGAEVNHMIRNEAFALRQVQQLISNI